MSNRTLERISALEVIRCGQATSIQDEGRTGYARLGLAPGGVMDRRALHAANSLVGNLPGEAAIECAFLGIELRVVGGPVRLALAGARARIRLNGAHVADHESFIARDRDIVTIGRADGGMYTVLAIAGGLAIAPVLASRSTDIRAGIGGHAGRQLRAGDRLELRVSVARPVGELAVDPVVTIDDRPIRVVGGPQWHHFTQTGHANLLEKAFVVSHAVDRMACRLVGPQIERAQVADIISEPTFPGSIQIPPDGAPLIMMADRQTIGGYPKIATIIGADLRRLAQMPPGASLNFCQVSMAEAEMLARRAQEWRPAPRRAMSGAAAGFHFDRIGDAAVSALAAETWEFRERRRN